MKLIIVSIYTYFHIIPLWKSPIKLPVEATRWSYPWSYPLQKEASPTKGLIRSSTAPTYNFCCFLLFL